MKKKNVVIVIAILIMMIISSNSLFLTAMADSCEVNLFANFECNINESKKIYEIAMAPYLIRSRSATGMTSYTDNFSGVYLDSSGILTIGLNDISQKGATYDGRVNYVEQKFSYNQLEEVQNSLTVKMLDYGINQISIDEELNQICVFVDNQENVNSIIDFLKSESVYEESMLNFSVDSNQIYTNYSKDIAYGGEALLTYTSLTTAHLGTICVNAIDNATGRVGILTNEHVACSTNNPPALEFYGGQYDVDTNKFSVTKMLGIGTKGQQSGTIDAAFVPFHDSQDEFSNPNGWSETPCAQYDGQTFSNIELGEENQIVQGQPIKKIGQTTGVTTGKITNKNAVVRINNSTLIRKTFLFETNSDHGDSGAPVYFEDSINHSLYLIGMLFAGTPSNGIAACRISEVMNQLNVTPITNSNYFAVNESNGTEIEGVNFDSPQDVVIPSVIAGNNILSIGAAAFRNKTNLEKVTFASDSKLTNIGAQAFRGCTNLKDILFPATVGRIDTNAFLNCTKLQSVTFDKNGELWEIGSGAFNNCTKLTEISFPNKLTKIGNEAFYWCVNLKKVVFGNRNNIADFGTNCFQNTASDLKLYVASNLYSEYRSSASGQAYANKFVKTYLEGNQLYYEDITAVPAEGYFTCNTNIYAPNLPEKLWFYRYDIGMLGYDRNDFISECTINYSLGTYDEMRLAIEVGEGVDCLAFDNNADFIALCPYEEGYVYVPLKNLYEKGGTEFYLLAIAPGAPYMEFYVSDVTILLVHRNYL